MKALSAAVLLAACRAGVLAQDIFPPIDLGGARIEQERALARLTRAEFAPGQREKLRRLAREACAGDRRFQGGRIETKDEGHRLLSSLELTGRSLLVVRFEREGDCALRAVHLGASRTPWNWPFAGVRRFHFDVPAFNDAMVDRDDYQVFLEEMAFWTAFELPAR